ncbi:MAG: DNA-3-methyladenine glycosylase 2 family protein [Nocardiopsaceae bacterium]|nr:DNA-3-methyladenine glycosylase 2 family protein [Nocardiopsaceae bacterium]
MDDEQRYQALTSKDARFDGVFITAVTSTGIYCRPSCPAITPKQANIRFYKSAAAAQEAGFRACKRCRPDASPGSPEWNVRADVTARAMRLIADGTVDRDGIGGLASRLGYEQRQVRRLLTDELGAGPLALARARRAQTARTLIETTSLPMGDIAFAAGFSSIRQFNATIQEVFDLSPTELRERATRRVPAGGPTPAVQRTQGTLAPGAIRLRLPLRPPFDAARLLGFLAARAIVGVEEVTGGAYKRTIALPNGSGRLSLLLLPPPARPSPISGNFVECDLELDDLRDVGVAVQRCRRLLDLDADPVAISESLGSDPVIGPLARACPGRRSPGHMDGDELAMRALLGQQVSVAAARTLGARLVTAYGKPLSAPSGGLTHLFPDAATIAAADPEALPMPRARARALVGLATALASGDVSLHPGADRDETEARLLALPGIGPWTASYIRMRALSDPDVFLPTDAGVIRALRGSPDSDAWRPWRSYAVHHLWATLEDPMPERASTP